MSILTLFPKRQRWKRAARLWLGVTLTSLALMLGVRFFAMQVSVRAAGLAGLDARKPSSNIDALNRKIQAETQQHRALVLKRTQLASSARQVQTIQLSPQERASRELTRRLIQLLALEKQYPEDSPEISDTRQAIDALQSQIAEMPPTGRRSAVTRSVAVQPVELTETDNELSLNEVQTKADGQQLAQLLRAKKLEDARPRQYKAQGVPFIVEVSLILGFIAALGLLALHRNRAIRDEAALYELLPHKVEVVGTVPHMRSI